MYKKTSLGFVSCLLYCYRLYINEFSVIWAVMCLKEIFEINFFQLKNFSLYDICFYK